MDFQQVASHIGHSGKPQIAGAHVGGHRSPKCSTIFRSNTLECSRVSLNVLGE